MAPQDTIESKFALEGFLPLWAIIAGGVALLVVSWWIARRDSRFADRRKFVWLLFALRVVAILVLLWMLAGPTHVTTARKFKTKSIAVLVDSSASMGLVDVIDGSGNVSRWAAAREDSREARLIRQLDEGVAMLRAGQAQLDRFARMPDATRKSDDARALLSHGTKAVTEGARKLAATARELPEPGASIGREIGEVLQPLNGPFLETLQAKSAEFSRGKTLTALERERWLPPQLAQLAAALGSAEQLVDRYVTTIEEPVAESPGAAANEESKRSRFDKVELFLTDAERGWLAEIRKKATVTRYEFGEKVVPLGATPWEKTSQKDGRPRQLASGTQIGRALQQVALDQTTQPVAAAILITDGGQNAGRDPRELAPSLAGAALHIVPIGNTKMQRDVILHHTHAPKAVLQNDNVVIDSIITAYDCEKEKLRVELLAGEIVVDQQTIDVTGEVFDRRVQLRWKAAQLGKHALAMRVVPVSDERTEENNVSRADIQVMEDKIRVLVADNYPRWETRYLLNLFKRDDRVVFDQLLFEPQPSAGEGVRTGFPTTLEEWAKYRVVILGDVLPTQLTAEHQKLIREYVSEAGGNLIMVAGKDAMPGAFLDQPLGALLPVQSGERALPENRPFYLHVTDEGSMTLATQVSDQPGASERIWREMSERMPIYALSEFSRPKPATHSLIWASASKSGFNPGDALTRSFLAWQYVGAGRVVYLAAPVTYQLRYRQGDAFHHRFWGQLLRWAVARDLAEGSQTVRLSTDKSRYEQGEVVQASVRLRQLDGRLVTGAALQISAVQDGQLTQEIQLKEEPSRPGTYNGVLEQLPAGPVRLQVSGDRVKALLAAENYRRPIETTISIDPSGELELRHPLCNLPLLREIADASGGIIVPPTGLQAALAQINLDPEVLENISKKPLWNRWDLFWLFIACLTLEWAGRKYLGLS